VTAWQAQAHNAMASQQASCPPGPQGISTAATQPQLRSRSSAESAKTALLLGLTAAGAAVAAGAFAYVWLTRVMPPPRRRPASRGSGVTKSAADAEQRSEPQPRGDQRAPPEQKSACSASSAPEPRRNHARGSGNSWLAEASRFADASAASARGSQASVLQHRVISSPFQQQAAAASAAAAAAAGSSRRPQSSAKAQQQQQQSLHGGGGDEYHSYGSTNVSSLRSSSSAPDLLSGRSVVPV